MKNSSTWATISLFNFCLVAVLGVTLRSKILFDLPWINYLSLLDAHSHLAFGGWLTLAFLMLFVRELLPERHRNKNIYQLMLLTICLATIGTALSNIFGLSLLKDFFSGLFIVTTYIFGWTFIKGVKQSAVNKTSRFLSVSAVTCLMLSSIGPIALAYLQTTQSLQSFFYRDALYIYLHFLYNGFFPLAVFALLFQKIYPKIQSRKQRNFHWFSLLLCLSVLPSLFLSFLWQAPNEAFRIIALTGSVLLLATALQFIIATLSIIKLAPVVTVPVKMMIFLSAASFILKIFLQSLTIFTVIGNAVFGDRPIIIGFLHLVFLGFASPFIFAYYTQEGILDTRVRIVVHAQILFIVSVCFNEITLMLQGIGTMFLKSSHLFSWLLWGISIGLLIAVVLIFVGAIKSAQLPKRIESGRELKLAGE